MRRTAVSSVRPTTNVTIVDNDTQQPAANIIGDGRAFVRQQYHDLLNREPDRGGWDYWTELITRCAPTDGCLTAQRISVSAAFFIEPEFQDTGFYAYRLFVATFGRAPSYLEFIEHCRRCNRVHHRKRTKRQY
jgi:hypothetical protein